MLKLDEPIVSNETKSRKEIEHRRSINLLKAGTQHRSESPKKNSNRFTKIQYSALKIKKELVKHFSQKQLMLPFLKLIFVSKSIQLFFFFESFLSFFDDLVLNEGRCCCIFFKLHRILCFSCGHRT